MLVASHGGHVEVVDKLLQHGAKVDQKGEVRMLLHSDVPWPSAHM